MTSAPSHWARIHMAGSVADAERVCREYCFEVGECVTVTPTTYIYKGGAESGFLVSFINYPRFPRNPEQLQSAAMALAKRLMVALFQESYCVETPDTTAWCSRREA